MAPANATSFWKQKLTVYNFWLLLILYAYQHHRLTWSVFCSVCGILCSGWRSIAYYSSHLKCLTLATDYAKNYCNRTLIVQVILENVVTFFWDTVLSPLPYPPHEDADGSSYSSAPLTPDCIDRDIVPRGCTAHCHSVSPILFSTRSRRFVTFYISALKILLLTYLLTNATWHWSRQTLWRITADKL